MVRDKNGILAEVNDPLTVKESGRPHFADSNHIIHTVVSYTSGAMAELSSYDDESVLITNNSYHPFKIQANKILGTDANGDLVWLDDTSSTTSSDTTKDDTKYGDDDIFDWNDGEWD